MNDTAIPQATVPMLDHLREHDTDRYLATLFAPADKQAHLAALYAFNAEIGRVRGLIHEPAMGEIRFQWWREVLSGERGGEARDNPVAAALLETVRACSLPTKPLVDLIDARTFDLYDDPMPTWLDLEGYCGETSSVLIRLAGLILADQDIGGAAAAGHAGVAYALTGLLRAFPWTSRRGQVFVPVAVLDGHRVTPSAIRQGEDTPGLRSALAEVRARARHHLSETRKLAGQIDSRIRAAFLPVAFVEPYLNQMEGAKYEPFRSQVELSKLRKLWRLWWQCRRAGIS